MSGRHISSYFVSCCSKCCMKQCRLCPILWQFSRCCSLRTQPMCRRWFLLGFNWGAPIGSLCRGCSWSVCKHHDTETLSVERQRFLFFLFNHMSQTKWRLRGPCGDRRQAERTVFDEHPSGPHSGESVLRFPNTQTAADIIPPISVSQVEQLLRTGIVWMHACRVLLLSVYVFTAIIKLFSHWSRQKVMCIKSKRNQEREQPQRRPKLTQEHHCYSWQTGGVSIRKEYQEMVFFCISPWSQIVWDPALRDDSLSWYFRTEKADKAWKSRVCYQH